MKVALLIATAVLAFLAPARASTNEDIFRCASISNDKERLSCFDAVAKLTLARETTLPENYILQRFKKSADK